MKKRNWYPDLWRDICSNIVTRKFEKEKGFYKNDLKKLNCKVNVYGISNLTAAEYRSYVLINFLYYTMCRYDCMSRITMENVKYSIEWFSILVPKSKTDQAGKGQYVYVPKLKEFCPHSL